MNYGTKQLCELLDKLRVLAGALEQELSIWSI